MFQVGRFSYEWIQICTVAPGACVCDIQMDGLRGDILLVGFGGICKWNCCFDGVGTGVPGASPWGLGKSY